MKDTDDEQVAPKAELSEKGKTGIKMTDSATH